VPSAEKTLNASAKSRSAAIYLCVEFDTDTASPPRLAASACNCFFSCAAVKETAVGLYKVAVILVSCANGAGKEH